MENTLVENKYQIRKSFMLEMMILTVFSFSTDLRIGLNLKIDSYPNFQLFEIILLCFMVFLIISLPRFFLQETVLLDRVDFLLFIFILNALVQAVFSEDVFHSLSRSKDFFWAFFIYLMMRYVRFDVFSLRFLVKIVVIVPFVWAILGIIQWFGWDDGYGGEGYRLFLASQSLYKTALDPFAGTVVSTRFAHGFYLYPQNFVYYLIPPFFLSFGLVLKNRIWIMPVVIIFTAILGTFSKTFLLLLVSCGFLWFVQAYVRNFSVSFGVFFSLLWLGVLWVLWFGDRSFWSRAFETFVWRLDIWKDACRMLQENPWLLVAGGGTRLLASDFSRVGYPNPHNIFLYFLIEYGVLGFVTIFGFLFFKLSELWNRLNGLAWKETGASWGLFVGLVLFLCMGLVDDIFVQTQLTAIFFFYLGLLCQLEKS